VGKGKFAKLKQKVHTVNTIIQEGSTEFATGHTLSVSRSV